MATEMTRYTVSLDEDTFKAVDDFRFDNRFNTRTDATIALIRLGLKAAAEEKECTKQENM